MLSTSLLSSPFAKDVSRVHTDSQVTLSQDVTTTPPDRVTYRAGSVGRVRKVYNIRNSSGFIVEMGDGRKIPVPIHFLCLPQSSVVTSPLPLPYQTSL